MSTTGREWHSVLWTFKGHRECTRHHATCGALPATGPYLRLSRFQGGQASIHPGRALGFAATAAPSYSSRPGSCSDGRVSVQLGTVTQLPVHPASPVQLTKYGPLRALDFVGWRNNAAIPSYLFKYCCGPPPEFPLALPRSGIVHHLLGPDRHAHTRTLLRRSRSVGYAPVRDPANQLPCALRVYSPFDSHTCKTPWSVLQDGSNGEPTGRRPVTCSLLVSRPYLALDRIYRPIGAAFPNNPTRRQRLVVRQGPGMTGLSPSLAPLSRELGPGPSLRTLLQTTIRTPKTTETSDYMTRIEFTTTCQDAHGILSSDFGQPRTITHGRSASVSYPREDGGTICDTQADVPSARRLGAQLAFNDSMVHGILQFTPSIAFCYILHRCESRDIHCRDSYAYDPTKTEVLGMDERITTELAGTVRNRPTESDVSSFSGHSVSRSNWKTDETRPRPHKRKNLKLGAKRSAGKLAGKVTGKFTGDNLAIDLNPDIDSVGPSSPTLHTPSGGLSVQHTEDARVCPSAQTGCPCVSVSTHRTSVAVHQYTYQHAVHTGRLWVSASTHMTSMALCQHTQDVRVCPCVSVITHRTSMAVHLYTYQHASPWSQHAGSSRGLFGTSVDVHQYTYQHAGPSRGLFG
ncbi:hypothetical protein YC2023_066015 [Brassica napus]